MSFLNKHQVVWPLDVFLWVLRPKDVSSSDTNCLPWCLKASRCCKKAVVLDDKFDGSLKNRACFLEKPDFLIAILTSSRDTEKENVDWMMSLRFVDCHKRVVVYGWLDGINNGSAHWFSPTSIHLSLWMSEPSRYCGMRNLENNGRFSQAGKQWINV